MESYISFLKFVWVIIKFFLKGWPLWIWFPPVIVLIGWLNSPKTKGKAGEKRALKNLKTLPGDKYFLLNDLLLKTDEGTSQIDHIVVSVYGIFIIEIKNYQGLIYGSEHSYNWTQNIYGNKTSFKNPIHQNYAHVTATEKALSSFGSFPIKSIVAFSEKSKLNIETKDTPVIYIREIATYIKSLSTVEEISVELAKEIFETLRENNIVDKKERKKHIKEAKNKQYLNKVKIEQGICPYCGGNLIVKNGKYGQFIGCSNFPNCRYTKNK